MEPNHEEVLISGTARNQEPAFSVSTHHPQLVCFRLRCVPAADTLSEDTMSALNPSTGIAYNQTSHVHSHVAEGASLLMPRQTDPSHTEKC